MKSIMNRLEIIENEIRSLKASLDYDLGSNDYTYTDDWGSCNSEKEDRTWACYLSLA